jgi:hypothetical protein
MRATEECRTTRSGRAGSLFYISRRSAIRVQNVLRESIYWNAAKAIND